PLPSLSSFPPPRHLLTPLFPYTPLFRSPLLLPQRGAGACVPPGERGDAGPGHVRRLCELRQDRRPQLPRPAPVGPVPAREDGDQDRKSTRLNSSHVSISYAVFCLKKKIH